jgi:hypothetical protein
MELTIEKHRLHISNVNVDYRITDARRSEDSKLFQTDTIQRRHPPPAVPG